MQISSNISNEEIKGLQKSFYEYFETGYAFEDILSKNLQTHIQFQNIHKNFSVSLLFPHWKYLN